MRTVDRSRLPQPAPDAPFAFPVVERRTLPNGLRVWTVEHRALPVRSVLVLTKAGAAADPADRPGLAAMTADMLDEGSGSRSALDIEDAMSRLGAQFETEVGSDATVISLLTLSRVSDEALGLLADIVVRPRLAEADFERVRELRLNRLTQLRDLAPAVAERALARLLYPEHPYGHLPLGSAASLKAMTQADVAAFHAREWQPSRVTVIVSGDGTHDELYSAIERAFGEWPTRSAEASRAGESSRVVTPAQGATRGVFIVDRPKAAQSELRIGQVAVSRDVPDYHSLLVLNAVLGGQFVSRLNMNLREEKGYTYGARSGFEFRRAPGPFVVQAAVQTGVTAAAITEALREVREIAGPRPVTAEEMALAQAALTRGYPRNFETSGQIARGLAQLALYDLPDDTLERFVPAVHEVDTASITASAQRVDPDAMTIAVVGDRAAIEADLTALGLGTPVVLENAD